MKSKKKNSTVGRGTPGSRDHGLTESDAQKRDKERLKALNGRIKGTKFVRVRVPVEEVNLDPDSKTDFMPEEKDLASFPSDFAALRRDQYDNLGYRIPRLVPGPNGDDVRMIEQRGRKKGAKLKEGEKVGNRKIPPAYSVVVPGQPDIDAGVDGWIQPTDTRDFVRRGNRMDSLLETFNRVTRRKIYEKDLDGEFILNSKGRKIVLSQTPYVKPFRAESSKLEAKENEKGERVVERVKTDAMTLSYRNTIGFSPGLSRALQRLLEDGYFLETRNALESTAEPFGRFYEDTYRGPETRVKLTSLVLHLDSGHCHYDTWNHATFLDTAPTGVDREIVPVRRWDAKASCHYGPGPGVTFWMRHFEALGNLEELAIVEPEVAKRVGYTKLLCEQAIAGCRQRAEKSFEEASKEKMEVEAAGGTYTAWIRPADDYARDIRVSQEADRLLTQAIRDLGLDKDYVAIGMAEYREHLIEAYKTGNTGIRMDTVEDLEQVQKVVERAEVRARGASETNKKLLLAIKLEKEAAALMRQEAEEMVAGVNADKVALKAALAAAEEARRVAEAARDEAIKAATKEAAPILEAARKAEARLPAKEFSMQKTVFERIFQRKTKSKNRAELLAELASSAETVRAEAVAAANKQLEPIRKDLVAREEKIGVLEWKAGLWDRVAPLLDRVFVSLTGTAKELVEAAMATDLGKQDTEIKGWAAMLARISKIVTSSKGKGRKPEKKQEPGVE